MENQADDKIPIHRYGLRMPESIFSVIEDIAWQSRISLNYALVELIVRGLADVVIKQASEVEPFAWTPNHAEKSIVEICRDDEKREKFLENFKQGMGNLARWFPD